MKKIILFTLLIFSFFSAFAQYGYRDSNRIGVFFGLNQFSLKTNNFYSKSDLGWNAGLSLRGNFYNNWDMVYGMQFSQNNFSVQTKNLISEPENVKYKLSSAQLSLQLSYIIVENYLSVEFGSILQFNGKFSLDSLKENNSISGTSLQAKDIQEISKLNFYPAIGITAGIKYLRFNFQYQYGLNNFLEIKNNSETQNFKGHVGILSANMIVYL